MAEPFDIKKATASLFSGLDWFKAGWVGIKIGCIIFIFIAIRDKLMPTPPQTQQTTIQVEPGGTLNLQQNQKKEEKKKWFETFGEVYVFAETDGRYGGGVRAGLKF